MVVRVFVDVHRAEQKLKVLKQRIKTASNRSTENICELGKNYARTIAPVRSGKLVKNITKSVTGSKGIIRSANPTYVGYTDKNGKFRNSRNFNLPKWLHTTRGLWRSGPLAGIKADFNGKEPRYMYRTAEYLKRVAKSKAQAEFNKIKI